MASVIAVADGYTYRGIRCQQSSLGLVGPILQQIYNQRNINRLFAAGDLASIDPVVPIHGTTSKTFSSLADLRWAFISCDVAYLLREDQWLFSPNISGPTEGVYVTLEKALKKHG
jgi:hypothetical protein